jgi:hypothetical protein
LLNWSDSQKASERLAASLLAASGYSSIDPAHPLGGRDRLKDAVCVKDGKRWLAAVYFPRGQKSLTQTLTKFKHDLRGVRAGEARCFAFVTNQYLTLAQRKAIAAAASGIEVDLLHLERIAGVLNTPANYGTRLDFLDIEMSKEEQLSFFAQIAELAAGMETKLGELLIALSVGNLASQFPTEELNRFKDTLNALTGYPGAFSTFSPVDRLRPPTHELRLYADELSRLVGGSGSLTFSAPVDRLRPPLTELREYETRIENLVGGGFTLAGKISALRPPFEALQEYEDLLDRVLAKTRELQDLPHR